MVYLITGKKGAGKTTYAYRLADTLESQGHSVVVVDGDAWRQLKGNDDFSDEGRRKNLYDAAYYAARIEAVGNVVICAFVSPYKKMRQMMRSLWMESRLVYIPGGELWEGTIYEVPDDEELGQCFPSGLRYSLFIGRYQPFHEGHEALIRKVLEEGKNVCIAIRDTERSGTDPYNYVQVKKKIEEFFQLEILAGKLIVIKIPDIEEVCYGRKVGWGIREIRLDRKTEQISATKIREGGKKNGT
jgi:energy-coupling factor transporter ATP-binding protein EcfA2